MATNHASRRSLKTNQAETTRKESLNRISDLGEPLLTTRELARELRVTGRTIQNLVKRGEIRKIQIGRCVRFKKSDVLEDLQNQEKN